MKKIKELQTFNKSGSWEKYPVNSAYLVTALHCHIPADTVIHHMQCLHSQVKKLAYIFLWRVQSSASFLSSNTNSFLHVRSHLIPFAHIKLSPLIFPPGRLCSFCMLSYFLSLIFIDDKKSHHQILLHEQPRHYFASLYIAIIFNFSAQDSHSDSLLVEFPFAIPSVFVNFSNFITLWKKKGFWVNNFSSLEPL